MSYEKTDSGLWLPKGLLGGRITPQDRGLHPESQDSIDWWNEEVRRSYEGHEVNGTRVTGDFYWYTNFFPIQRLVQKGNANSGTVWDLPWPSQEDDWLCKQFEEAEQDNKFVMFFTARGYGKTFLVISIGGKLYMTRPNSHSIFSASSENHIKETYNNKMLNCIDEMNKRYAGTLSKNTFKRDETDIESGVEHINEKGEKVNIGYKSRCERIIYGPREGATKGRRPDFQLFEEVGDWSGAAKLKECNAASRGAFMRGSLKTCRVFYIGTGGQMAAGGSRHARDMFYNPDAFNIYPVTEWKGKKTAIFISSDRKREGYWEKNGVSDREGARLDIEKMREQAKTDPTTYFRLLQEYPFNPEECFLVQGANIFPQHIVAEQLVKIDEEQGPQGLPERGRLEWQYASPTSNQITGVRWVKDEKGKILIVEHPQLDQHGNVYRNLYVGGYDGIDIGSSESESGKGSCGSIHIKKRFLNAQSTNNLYVAEYCDRPEDVDENYENCLKLSWYYGCQLNIEFTRVGIVRYFMARGQQHRFMPRPTVQSGDTEYGVEKKSNNLIGTTMSEKVRIYGEQSLAKYMKEFGYQFWFYEALEEMRDYTPDEKQFFDRIVSMIMCEIADDEILMLSVQETQSEETPKHFGYYTDAQGVMQYGILPGQHDTEQLFARDVTSGHYQFEMPNGEHLVQTPQYHTALEAALNRY
jgi:hypothetical protein